jgi:hypothetical protein
VTLTVIYSLLVGPVETEILRKEILGMTEKKMVQPATRRHQEKSKEPVII